MAIVIVGTVNSNPNDSDDYSIHLADLAKIVCALRVWGLRGDSQRRTVRGFVDAPMPSYEAGRIIKMLTEQLKTKHAKDFESLQQCPSYIVNDFFKPVKDPLRELVEKMLEDINVVFKPGDRIKYIEELKKVCQQA
jgi:hypothetical protein